MTTKRNEDQVFREMFTSTDSVLIIDVNGKVLYHADFNDEINMLRHENVIGKSIFQLYPFFRREDFIVFKAIDTKKVIVNQPQQFEVNGQPHKALTSAYPLINETGVIGGLVMSRELKNISGRRTSVTMSAKYNFSDIITQNITFQASFERLRRLASGDFNVLIYGETGTGKELIAHTIHANSPRRNHPFIIQNCASIPPNLIESIFYGSAKGSFTGAMDKPGLFEIAEGGTLFLDEVNSIPLEQQGTFLRAIENKTIRRVGETFERSIDVRIISSTNEMLDRMLESGQFRKDLLYRLNVASYSIPPLRERADDIPLLCAHYIDYFNGMYNYKIEGVDSEVRHFFFGYPWEGNVRELRNVIEYACNVKTRGLISMNDIPDYMRHRRNMAPAHVPAAAATPALSTLPVSALPDVQPAGHEPTSEAYIRPGETLASQVERLEADILSEAALRHRYNISKMAAELEVSRQTLYKKMKKYGLL